MQVLEYKEFRKSLVALRARGGGWQRAAEKAIVLLDDLKGDPEALAKLPVTHHGESRIKKAIKYDLGGGGCRLVTIQNQGLIFLCFVGDHDQADQWIERNKGLTVRVDERSRAVTTFESIDITAPERRIEREMGYTRQPLVSLLEERLQDALLQGIPWSVATQIAEAEVHIDDDSIERLAELISNQEQREAVFDSLILLRSDDIEGANNRVRAFLGELRPVSTLGAEAAPLIDSPDFQHIPVDSEHYRKLIEHFARNADYKDWMLLMHPDQQQYVTASYSGPTKLSGVSGSGKTCVVVRRALALAERYPDERILVLTLNRSLASLIQALVEKAAPPSIRAQIDVEPFFRLCQHLLCAHEPSNARLYDDVTWKSKEHIDEIWREFYRCELNSYAARVLQRLHDSLISRGIDAESYIREEFDWIRSATAPDARSDYLRLERVGRSYPLDEAFRRELLEGLEHWERKMRFVGVTDYLGIASALYRHLDKISPSYRCILIDESQDFGTLDIRVVRRLVGEAENDVFLCGDAAQQVSSKHQNLAEAGVPVPGARSYKLTLNYRNSREILQVAHGVLVDNLTEQMIDAKDFDVLDPKYANFSGPAPLLLAAGNLGEELASAIAYAKSEAAASPVSRICVAVCGYSAHELSAFAIRVGLPVLNGETNIENDQVFLSDLENTKGFEFQCMIVLNCSQGVVPYPKSPEEESFRDLSRLYVAMTRAKNQLVVSFNGGPSRFLIKQMERFAEDTWSNYLGGVSCSPLEPPEKLDQLRLDEAANDPSLLTGEQYLYTDHAIGCPAALIEKLRLLVTGKSRLVNGHPVEWKSIGAAMKDVRVNPRSRQAFGPEGVRLFRARFDELV